MTAPRDWSFSLQTLFVMVGTIGLLLGWLVTNWRIVAARSAAMDEIEDWERPPDAKIWCEYDDAARAEAISRIRRLLGDVAVRRILLVGSKFPTDRRERIRALFPEATVVYVSQLLMGDRCDTEMCDAEMALPSALSRPAEVRRIQSQFPQFKIIPFPGPPDEH